MSFTICDVSYLMKIDRIHVCDRAIKRWLFKTWLFDKRPSQIQPSFHSIYGTLAEFTGAFIAKPCFNLYVKTTVKTVAVITQQFQRYT